MTQGEYQHINTVLNNRIDRLQKTCERQHKQIQALHEKIERLESRIQTAGGLREIKWDLDRWDRWDR